MEKILIGSSIPDLTLKTIADLTVGQVGVLLYNVDESKAPVMVGSEVTAAIIKAAKGFQFVRRDSADTFDSSVVIPAKTLRNINYQPYVAGVAGIFKLGDNATTTTAITVAENKEGCIRLIDLTDSYQVDNFPANICLDKRSTETGAQYLARFVAKINLDPVAKTLVVAALEEATGKYQIKLTTLNSDIKLGIATDGVFAEYQPITVTARKLAKGTGVQIQEIEKELSVFRGNGNYMESNDLYYKEPLKASATASYNTLSVSWTGVAQPTVSATMSVANLNLLLVVPVANTTLATIYAALTS
jgi:hypothetical protein